MEFLTKNWRGLAALGLGLLTVVLASTLHVCADEGNFVKTASGMNMHMACTWTQRAVMGFGGVVALTGLIMTFAGAAARAMSLLSGLTGALIIATPLWLVPTCKNAMMTCNEVFKPAVLILGGLILVVGLAGSIASARSKGAALAA
ncbi:MAG TPA: DUF4418 family protein [Symbiobacteriaceae bacterium]|nr:DUF4418 family protein [Symbiobacteriaceae bacterium]